MSSVLFVARLTVALRRSSNKKKGSRYAPRPEERNLITISELLRHLECSHRKPAITVIPLAFRKVGVACISPVHDYMLH